MRAMGLYVAGKSARDKSRDGRGGKEPLWLFREVPLCNEEVAGDALLWKHCHHQQPPHCRVVPQGENICPLGRMPIEFLMRPIRVGHSELIRIVWPCVASLLPWIMLLSLELCHWHLCCGSNGLLEKGKVARDEWPTDWGS